MPAKTSYREHPPAPDLKPWIACYWAVGPDSAPRPHTVLPDACMDVLFDLAAGDARLVGTMTRPLQVTPGCSLDIVAVRFRPAGAAAFVELPAAEVTDLAGPLDRLWSDVDLTRLLDGLRARTTDAARFALVDATLRRRLGRRRSDDPATLAAAGVLVRSGGRLDVASLATLTGIGRRQLERRFRAAVGIPPGLTGRVLRFQGVLDRLLADRPASLTRIARSCGYHDQAHMTRDFKEFSGDTPAAFRQRRRVISDVSVQDAAATVSL